MNAPGFFRSISLFISVTVFPGRRDGFRGFCYLCCVLEIVRFIIPRPCCEIRPGFSFRPENGKSNLRAILATQTGRMVNYTSFGFASISAAFLNRDGNVWPQCRVWPLFELLKLFLFPFSPKAAFLVFRLKVQQIMSKVLEIKK